MYLFYFIKKHQASVSPVNASLGLLSHLSIRQFPYILNVAVENICQFNRQPTCCSIHQNRIASLTSQSMKHLRVLEKIIRIAVCLKLEEVQ